MNTQNNKTAKGNYKNDVLNVNAEFKISLRSTGKAIKILIASETLKPNQIAFLKDLQKKGKNEAEQIKIDSNYSKFDATIRRTKSNTITPFYVLQALYKAMNK